MLVGEAESNPRNKMTTEPVIREMIDILIIEMNLDTTIVRIMTLSQEIMEDSLTADITSKVIPVMVASAVTAEPANYYQL